MKPRQITLNGQTFTVDPKLKDVDVFNGLKQQFPNIDEQQILQAIYTAHQNESKPSPLNDIVNNVVDVAGRFIKPQAQNVGENISGMAAIPGMAATGYDQNTHTWSPVVPVVNALTSEYGRIKNNYNALVNKPGELINRAIQNHGDISPREALATGAEGAGNLFGMIPFVGGMFDRSLNATGQDIRTGNDAGALGNFATIPENLLAGEITEGAGNAIKGIPASMVRTSLRIPKNLTRDFGDIGQAFIDTKTLPSTADATIKEWGNAKNNLIGQYDANNPQPSYHALGHIATDAQDYVNKKLDIANLGFDRPKIQNELSDALNNYISNYNPNGQTMAATDAQRIAEGRLANWPQSGGGTITQTSPVNNLFRQGLAIGNRNWETANIPGIDDILKTQQGLLGGREAYASSINAPHAISQMFELGMLPIHPTYSAINFFGRAPNAMTGTAIGLDSLRNAFLNPTAGNTALLSAILGRNQQE